MTVIIATRAGLPISTTHALIGGLVGAGLAASPQALQFAKLGQTFMLPLLLSPFLAAGLGLLSYRVLRWGGKQSIGNTKASCACIVTTEPVAAMYAVALPTLAAPRLMVAAAAECDRQGAVGIRVSIPRVLDRLHISSAGLICFARAVNDTPKLASLLAASQLLNAQMSLALIAMAMVVGGLLLSRRVAQTMSQRVTRMDPNQGLSANLITATLVLGASQFGLPVSTTHVSVGAIAGAGKGANTLNAHALRTIVLSWVATLPIAAGLAWLIFHWL